MGPGPTDLVLSRSDGVNLPQIDKIPASRPSQDLIQSILEHEKNGVPLVVTGVHFDQRWHPQPSPFLEVNSPADHETDVNPTENNTSATLLWLERLSLIPGYLLSRDTDTRFPQVLKDVKQEQGGNGRAFQQNHCGSVLQHLTSDLPDGSSNVWFISAASQQVASYLPTYTGKPSPAFLETSEPSLYPFPTYTHRQSVGDLLVLPPSCYGQNLRAGEVCSISWSRVTLRSMELSMYCELPMYRRLCHPERYEIRRAVHVALLSHTTELNKFVLHGVIATSDQEPVFSRVVQELMTLVRIFDEVLLEEYCKDHDLLNSPDVHPGRRTCNFCGACLFLSSFFCDECSGATSGSTLICPGCYVEGRSCNCKVMDAVRLGDFQGALRDRNSAVSSLSNSSHLHRMSTEGLAEAPESYFAWPRVAVFEAARELWKSRSAPDASKRGKTCTLRGKKAHGKDQTSHLSPPISLVNCKKCHAAKCFLHILGGSVHASEVILASAAEPGSAVWHKRHQEARERKEHPVTDLSSVFDLDVQERRVFFARHFSSTSPLKPSMHLGFYDTPLPLTEASSNREATTSADIPTTPQLPAPTQLSRTSSRSTVTLEDTEVPSAVNRPGRQTRQQSLSDVDLGSGPSARKPKRARISDGEENEGDDDEYRPSKRTRVGLPPTRAIRTASPTPSIAAVTSDQLPHPHRPPVGTTAGQPSGSNIIPSSSQLTSNQGWVQSNVRQPTSLRRPRRTASVASLLSRAPSTTNHHPAAEPFAFKFFDPRVDMEVTVQPVKPTDKLAGSSSNDHSENLRCHGPTFPPQTQSQSLRPPFVVRGSYEGSRDPSSSRSLGAAGPSPNHNTPSGVENVLESKADGSTSSYRESFPTHPRRQSSLPWSPTNPTNSQAPGVATTSMANTKERKSSLEEIEARKVLETIEGDSLSQENMGAYIDILRKFGALEG